METSVVMCAFNAESTIVRQLEALAAQETTRSWELVVVNNRCTDRTVELVRSFGSSFPVCLRIVDATGAQGLSYARNVGVSKASGDFILMCDSDDEADPGWLEQLSRALDAADLAGGHLEVDALNGKDSLGLRSSPTRGGLPDAFGITAYPVGANCGVRRSVIDALGGWDVRYTVCGDDVDFGIRAALAGFRIAFAPDAVVHYRLRPDVRTAARQRYRYTVVSMSLRRQYRDHVTSRVVPPLGRQVGWLLVQLGRYPRLDPRARDRVAMVGAMAAGRLVGGLLALVRRSSRR